MQSSPHPELGTPVAGRLHEHKDIFAGFLLLLDMEMAPPKGALQSSPF